MGTWTITENNVRRGDFGAPAQVTVGVASTLILAANITRTQAILVNDSDTAIYLSFDGNAAVLNMGIRVNPGGGSISVGGANGLPLTTGQVAGISSAAGKIMAIQEATQ